MSSPATVIPRQDEIAIEIDGDNIVISQRSVVPFDRDDVIFVHRQNLAAFILALRRLDGQEV